MTEINLLPWREQKREREKNEFMIYLLAAVVFAVIMVFSINYYARSLVDQQTQRNNQIKTEITRLEEELKEIKTLKVLRQTLIARMNIVQDLQATRTLTVRLLNEIIDIIPDGVYLYQIGRIADKVTLLGYAVSNTNISDLMRSIGSSVWTQDPQLAEIKKSIEVERSDNNEFKLSFVLKSKSMLGTKGSRHE
jgi:type IV pilus assembly protein PilN